MQDNEINWTAIQEGAIELTRVIDLGLIEPEEVAQKFMAWTSASAFAQLVLQSQMVDPLADQSLSREQKAFALEVAEALGPDLAQSLYRFTVLVTRLA